MLMNYVIHQSIFKVMLYTLNNFLMYNLKVIILFNMVHSYFIIKLTRLGRLNITTCSLTHRRTEELMNIITLLRDQILLSGNP